MGLNVRCANATKRMRAAKARAAVALAMVTAAGCVQAPYVHNLQFRPLMTDPMLPQLSVPIDLVADNQQFHIGGMSYLFRSGYIDKTFSASDVRVPQQDLFGESLLELAARFNQGRLTAVHLGDALDVSCADEWATFARIMDARKRWYWAPGNHDGYFFGNFATAWGDQWGPACDGSTPMNKAQVIQAYLAHLRGYTSAIAAGASGSSRASATSGSSGSWTCSSECRSGALRRVQWRVEPAEFWRSFIVQEIDLTLPGQPHGVSLILIDTSTYGKAPRIFTSSEKSILRLAAGELGSLGAEQPAIVEQWVASARAEGRTVILGGHHQFPALDTGGKTTLRKLYDAGQMASYLSGHTHHGQYFVNVSRKGSWLEWNLGSILDHNPEFAELTVFGDGARVQIQPRRRLVSELLAGQTTGAQLNLSCEASWLPASTDPDFFAAYKQVKSLRPAEVDTQYFQTMLWALERYWRMVPTTTGAEPSARYRTAAEVTAAVTAAAGSRDLARLRTLTLDLLAAHRRRPTDPQQARSYQVCTSLWAAEYERRDVVTPTRDEDAFEIGGPK